MSDPDAIRAVAREVLAELLSETRANGNGHPPVVPQVPPPPVAAVLRPSNWAAPAAPGELVGQAQAAGAVAVEQVTISSDGDLERFVQSVLSRAEEIRAGRLRFTLEPSAAAATPGSAPRHIAKGAVTERTIRDAASQHSRLILSRRAVLTPLARDTARKLGVEIEREA